MTNPEIARDSEMNGQKKGRIDAHQHFWRYSPEEYGWIDDRMSALRRDYLPSDLAQELEQAGIGGVVSVQARQTLEETRWLLELAEMQTGAGRWIHGVVGWVPLASPELLPSLEILLQNRSLKGLRHVLQDEPDSYMRREDFNDGVAAAGRAGLTYDVLILQRMLPQAVELVDRHPNQTFILDHLAKPRIAEGAKGVWSRDLRELAKREHVYCKLSGLVTEANWATWTEEELKPFIDVALDTFGPRRLMAGSDWPVCTVASSYSHWFSTLQQMLVALSEPENERIFGGTASEVYRLDAQ